MTWHWWQHHYHQPLAAWFLLWKSRSKCFTSLKRTSSFLLICLGFLVALLGQRTWPCPDLLAVYLLSVISKSAAAMQPPATSTVATRLYDCCNICSKWSPPESASSRVWRDVRGAAVKPSAWRSRASWVRSGTVYEVAVLVWGWFVSLVLSAVRCRFCTATRMFLVLAGLQMLVMR